MYYDSDDYQIVFDLRPYPNPPLSDIYEDIEKVIWRIRGVSDLETDILLRVSDASQYTGAGVTRGLIWEDDRFSPLKIGQTYEISAWTQTIDERRIQGGDVFFDQSYICEAGTEPSGSGRGEYLVGVAFGCCGSSYSRVANPNRYYTT